MSPESVYCHEGQLVLSGEKGISSVNAETGAVRWRVKARRREPFRFRTDLDYGQYPHVVLGSGRS